MCRAERLASGLQTTYPQSRAAATVPLGTKPAMPTDVEEAALSQVQPAGGLGATSDPPKEDKKAKGWPPLWSKVLSVISGIFFLYYFYQAGGDIEKTRSLLYERYVSLPFYWPPETRTQKAAKLTTFDTQGLPSALAQAFMDWFVASDAQSIEGITRGSIIELMRDLGLGSDGCLAFTAFLQLGAGLLDDDRLTSPGLQESISLLSQLVLAPEKPRRGDELDKATARLKQKLGGSSITGFGPLMGLRQAPDFSKLAPPHPAVRGHTPEAAGADSASSANAALRARALIANDDEDDEVGLDEGQYRRMEDNRLRRIEGTLLQQLERNGTLTSAEEVRLNEVRRQRQDLSAGL